MPSEGTDPRNAEERRSAARNEARRAALTLARDSGASTVTRPLYPGAQATVTDIEPLAGARAARDLELSAQRITRDYIRQAREAGHTWAQIGHSLGLAPGADPDPQAQSVAGAAYSYAAGSPHTPAARTYGRSFSWTCQSCHQPISDKGLIASPADDEHGHTGNCPRLAQTVAAWDAQWEAEP